MEDRLREINDYVDSVKPDYYTQMINSYKEELTGYDYIDSVERFSVLKLKGSLRYIGKYDKKLRKGGLLVKIYKKEDKWYGIILKANKKYHVSYDRNYIYYLETQSDVIRSIAEYFICDLDMGKYQIN